MQTISKIFAGSAIVLMSTVVSCASITPHENYLDFRKRLIGFKIDGSDAPAHIRSDVLSAKRFIDKRQLNDGRIRYRFRFIRSCVDVYDVDPVSQRIVAISFE